VALPINWFHLNSPSPQSVAISRKKHVMSHEQRFALYRIHKIIKRASLLINELAMTASNN
jgi:hypothetical protein